MRFLELESSQAAYRADFGFYGLLAMGLGWALAFHAPGPVWPLLAATAAGYLLWGLLEYALHRFVLHGVQPFSGMHAQHHLRPAARIGTPTVVSAPLVLALLFAPAWWLLGPWLACAVTLGLVWGYLLYSLTHHACHHVQWLGLGRTAWFKRRLRWHALHHQRPATPQCFGVSHGLWDQVFGTAGPRAERGRRRPAPDAAVAK